MTNIVDSADIAELGRLTQALDLTKREDNTRGVKAERVGGSGRGRGGFVVFFVGKLRLSQSVVLPGFTQDSTFYRVWNSIFKEQFKNECRL